MKNIKSRLHNDDTLLGCWLNLGSSLVAEMIGLAGFDWVLIDLEHGAGTEKDALYQLQALEHGTAAVIIRVGSCERHLIQRALDYGAEGVMCPQVTSVAEAQLAVNAMRYSPGGVRGISKMVRAMNFGVNFETYFSRIKDDLVGIVQIETVEALNVIDEIAAIDGVDILFLGPSDLSMAMGIFGQFEHPRFIDALKKTAAAARHHNKLAGILLYDPDQFEYYHELGYRFIASGSDASFVNNGARALIKELNAKRALLE